MSLVSYKEISTDILKKASFNIAKQLEDNFRNYPEYKDYSNEQLTEEILRSINDGGIDRDLDFDVLHQILLDYALDNGMSSLKAKVIVNIALGSWDGTEISANLSHVRIPSKGNYYLEVFDTLKRIVLSMNYFRQH